MTSAEKCVTSFTTLLSRSTKLLHHIDGIDWKSFAVEAVAPPEAKAAAPQALEESEEESDGDDDLFGMLGGYESSEDEKETVADEQDDIETIEDDNDEEEEATLLKRAAAVHDALLLSLDLGTAAKELDLSTLIDSIFKCTDDMKVIGASNELATILAYILSPTTFEDRPKSFRGSQEKWIKVCSTNALLTIQFLYHLLQSDTFTGWNAVILPLMLSNHNGTNVSLLMKNDVLREAVFNLTAVSAKDGMVEQIDTICSVCIKAINDVTYSPNVMARQKKINVVCSVLVHLFDNIAKFTKRSEADLELVKDIITSALHKSVLIILQGVCYEVVEEGRVQPPLLSVDSLRVITGMLLLKLYPPSNDSNVKFGNIVPDGKSIELWNAILTLLSPYSTDLIEVAGSNRRRCKTWNHTAPLSATAIFCVVLPTFLSMELPTIANGSNKRCRPALQLSVWNLLRTCLGRCDDSPNFSGSSRDGGEGGGRGNSLLSRESKSADASSDTPTDQLLRRRSAHCVRILVENERERLKREVGGKKTKKEKKNNSDSSRDDIKCADAWMKYVLVFEMLEMEIELHLVDQVWPTLQELSSRVASREANDGQEEEVLVHLPQLVWEDIASILKRVLLSEAPTLRKLGLYRVLKGDAGIDVSIPYAADEHTIEPSDDAKVFMNKPKSKWKIKRDTGDRNYAQSAPLSVVSVSFVIDVVIVSYDSILQTKVGTNMQIDVDGSLKAASVTPLISDFLSNYAIALALTKKSDHLNEYVNKVFSSNLIKCAKARSLTTFFHAVAGALESIATESIQRPTIEQNTIRDTIRSMVAVFSSGGAPLTLQDALKCDLATALQHTKPWEKPDVAVVLQILALYPPEEGGIKLSSCQQNARLALISWLEKLGNGSWVKNVAPAISSAFVMGTLMPFEGVDWSAGVNNVERETGMAICTLAALKGNASEALWPAIFKGLQSAPPVDPKSSSFCRTNRAVMLLEFGCRERAISGMGNGDLVADKDQSLLPPPPNVESLLSNAIGFIFAQLSLVSTLLNCSKTGSMTSGANRSSEASSVSMRVAVLIDQLGVLHRSYPSSLSISLVVNSTLGKALELMSSEMTSAIESQLLLYAALSCDAQFTSVDSLVQMTKICEHILGIDFSSVTNGQNVRKDTKQALRSVFQYAKWGCISLLIPMIAAKHAVRQDNVHTVCSQVIATAKDSVDATPVIALSPLFKSVVESGSYVCNHSQGDGMSSSLQTTIDTLFAILDEENTSSNWVYMLHEICKLIFSPKLLREEYQTAYVNEKFQQMHILHAFENLVKMAGTTKPHILKTAASIISSAWLGESGSEDVGVLAIPYRTIIIDLLIYKEGKVDESALHQSSYQESVEGLLPKSTDASSITRAFVLVFLSKLPSLNSISNVVLTELVHFVIDGLLDFGCKGPAVGKPFISGSEEYARAIRSWQALCMLNQYVTSEKAKCIAPKLFQAMQHNTHGPVRYFIEVFAIQCTRSHPEVFGLHYIKEINRTDLSLQYVSSLMVLGGNIIVGKYSSAFFQSSNKQKIKDILCGAIPWLSSTQGKSKLRDVRAAVSCSSNEYFAFSNSIGFSRAIAQLLVHKLIPLIVDVESDVKCEDKCNDDTVLASIYHFLERNGEMARLRAKQATFFDSYDVDGACLLEGLLSIPVDEGEEASPTHLVDAIKDCLAEVYTEIHEDDAPLWKQMEGLSVDDKVLSSYKTEDNNEIHEESELVNFQRKILPIDMLDLSVQSMKDQRLFNAAGKRKQDLIICATLVDKVPNLAGLARTAEIFAASTLVMPNLLVKKQDDFKTISASANDWIAMEECKEEELLSWLYKKKSRGYAIVGLEQTSSSKCITKFKFPSKTVLLLGKEKEGIPVEFLSVVDQCIEIPQLGIIRSLNVHVTGAIAIWKYTEQMLKKSSKRKK